MNSALSSDGARIPGRTGKLYSDAQKFRNNGNIQFQIRTNHHYHHRGAKIPASRTGIPGICSLTPLDLCHIPSSWSSSDTRYLIPFQKIRIFLPHPSASREACRRRRLLSNILMKRLQGDSQCPSGEPEIVL